LEEDALAPATGALVDGGDGGGLAALACAFVVVVVLDLAGGGAGGVAFPEEAALLAFGLMYATACVVWLRALPVCRNACERILGRPVLFPFRPVLYRPSTGCSVLGA